MLARCSGLVSRMTPTVRWELSEQVVSDEAINMKWPWKDHSFPCFRSAVLSNDSTNA